VERQRKFQQLVEEGERNLLDFLAELELSSTFAKLTESGKRMCCISRSVSAIAGEKSHLSSNDLK
jgi:hypothetical protein